MRTAKRSAAISRRRLGESSAVARASAPATAPSQAHGVHGDAAPDDDVRGDDESEVFHYDLASIIRCWRARSRSMRSPRRAKYTNVNASTDTQSVRLIAGSSDG